MARNLKVDECSVQTTLRIMLTIFCIMFLRNVWMILHKPSRVKSHHICKLSNFSIIEAEQFAFICIITNGNNVFCRSHCTGVNLNGVK